MHRKQSRREGVSDLETTQHRNRSEIEDSNLTASIDARGRDIAPSQDRREEVRCRRSRDIGAGCEGAECRKNQDLVVSEVNESGKTYRGPDAIDDLH